MGRIGAVERRMFADPSITASITDPFPRPRWSGLPEDASRRDILTMLRSAAL